MNNKKNMSIISEEKNITRIDLIDSLKYYSLGKGWIDKPSQHKLKIVTYFNEGCESCVYELISWEKIINKLKNDNVSFLFYIKPRDINSITTKLEYMDFTYPVIIDLKNSFYEKNKLSKNKMLQTFLIDANNKILLIGNPIFNDEVKDSFFSIIKENQ